MSSEVKVFTDGTYVGRAQGVDFKSGSGVTVSGARDPGNSQIDLTITAGGTAGDTDLDIRYVAGTGAGLTGSDSNDGLTIGAPMATLQAAYDSLGSEGGTLILLNGLHDVGATGFIGLSRKPAIFTSLTGKAPWVTHAADAGLTFYSQMPTIIGTGTNLVKITGNVSNIATGWGFYGIGFDMRGASVTTGILAEDTNFLRVKDCSAAGRSSSSTAFIRSNHPNFDDVSWYRIENNYCRLVGLCYLNDGGSGNCNNCQIVNNVVFGSTGFAIRMNNAQRCSIYGNNLEGGATMSGIQLLGSSHYNHIMWNGGENDITPYVQYESGAYANYHLNFGTQNGSGTTLVNDLALSATASVGSDHIALRSNPVLTKTDDYQLVTGAWFQHLVDMNKATAVTFTVPLHATAPIGIGAHVRVRQKGVGQVTIAPEGGVTLAGTSSLQTRTQGSVVELQKIAPDSWAVWGDTVTELGYVEVTTNTTISATAEGVANDIVSLGAITYTAQPIVVEFFFPRVTNGTGGSTFFVLLNDSTVLGLVGLNSASGVAGVGIPVFGKRRFTPTAGSHTIKVAAYRNTANSTVEAGTGATTTFFPGYIRATLA